MDTCVILVHFFLLLFQILIIVWLTTALNVIIDVELIQIIDLIVVLISQYQEVAWSLKLWTIKLKFFRICPLMHSDKTGSLFIWFSIPRQHCQPCNRGVNIQIDRPAWFSSSGVPEVEAASPDRELPLQWKPSHKPLPVAWPLKAHVSSWHFLSVCLGNTGFHPVGPHFGLRLSGMMQNTSMFFMGGRQSTIKPQR